MSQDKTFGILVVGPEPQTISRLAGALLQDPCLQVAQAPSTEGALALLGDLPLGQEPRVLVLSWQQQGMQALVFIQKLRREARFDFVDVIVSSDALASEDLLVLEELGIRRIFSPNSPLSELRDQVFQLLQDQESLQGVEKQLQRMRQALRLGEVAVAENLAALPEVDRELNGNPRFIHLLGELYIARKQFDAAAERLRAGLKGKEGERPGSAVRVRKVETMQTLTVLGKALCLAGKYKEALVVFERLAAKSPQNFSHRVHCGDALLGVEQEEDAERAYNEVLAQDPTHQDALVGILKAKVVRGDLPAAQAAHSRLSGGFESYALASFFNNRGVALVRSGKTAEAIRFYENALRFLKVFAGYIYFNLGVAHLRLNQERDAEECFKKTLALADADFVARKSILKKFVRNLGDSASDGFIESFAQSGASRHLHKQGKGSGSDGGGRH